MSRGPIGGGAPTRDADSQADGDAIVDETVGVSSTSSAPSTPSPAIVVAICAAEIFGLAGYSIVPALLPQFIKAWSLTNSQAGWLAGIISAGYMLAVIPLVSATDRWPARHIFLASAALGTLASFGMALCDSLLPALGFRALAGIATAGMYMPGLRALTHGVEGTIRARIAAWYTSSFTVGASLSFLLGRVGTLLSWRSAFVAAGVLGLAGVLMAWAALPRGDSANDADSRSMLDLRPVLTNRDALVLIAGYATTIWGCVGLRQWIVVFLTFCAGDRAGIPAQASIILIVGALISFLGVPAGLLGNELSIRYGLRTVAALVFLLSALTGGLFGFTAMLPYIVVLGLSVVVGFIVQGNFSNLTSGVLAVAAPRYRGATIGAYSCIGFGAGFLGTLLFGDAGAVDILDLAGGTSRTLPVSGARANFPMVIDGDNQRVLVVFRSPPILMALSNQDGHVAAKIATCSDADDAFFDAKRRRVYVSCGDGVVDIFAAGKSGYRPLARIPTVSGARTSLFVPELDRLFVAVPAKRESPAAIWVFRPAP